MGKLIMISKASKVVIDVEKPVGLSDFIETAGEKIKCYFVNVSITRYMDHFWIEDGWIVGNLKGTDAIIKMIIKNGFLRKIIVYLEDNVIYVRDQEHIWHDGILDRDVAKLINGLWENNQVF